MTKTYKPFTEETLDDALAVIRERFPPSAVDIAKKVLANPLRKLCPDAGTIGYRDGRPVCFQATMLRRLYYGKKEIFGQVGGLTCKVLKGCPLSVMLETIERAEMPRLDISIFYGNSCCAATANMDQSQGGCQGPDSCARSLWRPVRPLSCLLYVVRRKLLKRDVPNWPAFDTRQSADFSMAVGDLCITREMNVQSSFFDVLMTDYLQWNEGLVSSRTAAEVDWMFGSRIASGQAVLLCARRDETPVGYILVGSDEAARRWRILDWFSVGNAGLVLDALLASASRFIRQETPGFMLEVRGFPDFSQEILRRHLPFTQQRGVNFFAWGSPVASLTTAVLQDGAEKKGWFFSPYDGDLVM